MIYSITAKLDTPFGQAGIYNILTHGAQFGFIYYDHIMAKAYEEAQILTPIEATHKVISYTNLPKSVQEGGPCVYVKIYESYAFLWFYKLEDGFLSFDMGGFTAPKKNGYYIDFPYYVDIMLQLCADFILLELKTDAF